MLPYIDAERLASLLPIGRAILALEQAFATGLPDAPARQHLDVDSGELLLMPAWGRQGVGVKLVTVGRQTPQRTSPLIQGIYVLLDAAELKPVALLDGAALTGLRTAAVSGVATKHLARDDARVLTIFGAGVQARAHLDAMCAVRIIEEVRVVSRTNDSATTFVEEIRAGGMEAFVREGDAVADSDIVCTCTTSRTPVFEGEKLAQGAHVNAVGSYRPDVRELDDATLRRATLVVESVEAAAREAGEIHAALGAGIATETDLVELSEVARGERKRHEDGEITVFKSVGLASEDLVTAAAAYSAYQEE